MGLLEKASQKIPKHLSWCTAHRYQAGIAKDLPEGISYRLYSVYKMLAGESEPELVVTGGLLKSST